MTPPECVMDEVAVPAVTERDEEDSQAMTDVLGNWQSSNRAPSDTVFAPPDSVGQHGALLKRHFQLCLHVTLH